VSAYHHRTLREKCYTVAGLAQSNDISMRDRALYCLCEASTLAQTSKGSDLAIPLWLSAAQTFATLAEGEQP